MCTDVMTVICNYFLVFSSYFMYEQIKNTHKTILYLEIYMQLLVLHVFGKKGQNCGYINCHDHMVMSLKWALNIGCGDDFKIMSL